MSLPSQPTPAARPYSDQYLTDYSKEHVSYEINMFFKTQTAFANNGTVPPPQNKAQVEFLSNLLTESYATHLRNLIDFLYPRGGKPLPTDVAAEDYCQGNSWVAAAPAITQLLVDARTRADKEVSHLTTSRIAGTPAHKHWNDPKIAAEIKALLKLFAKTAAPQRLDATVVAIIQAL